MANKRMPLDQAVAEYLTRLTGQKKAANTIKSITQSLTALERTVRNMTGKSTIFTYSINHTHTTAVFATNAWGPSTYNLHRTNLGKFFEWLRVVGYMPRDTDPMYGIGTQTVEETDKARIPLREWPKLYMACRHPSERMIIDLGLYLFLRGSEMSAIQIKHVLLDEKIIKVWRKKVKRHDDMPISAELDKSLRLYLTWYAMHYGELNPEWYLVPARVRGPGAQVRNEETQRFGDLKATALLDPPKQITRPYNYVKSILKRAGYAVDGEGAHTLRRSGARALFDELRKSGYDGALRRVMSMLDHNNAKTTEVYLGLRLEKVQRNEEIAGEVLFPSLVDVMAGYEGMILIQEQSETEESLPRDDRLTPLRVVG